MKDNKYHKRQITHIVIVSIFNLLTFLLDVFSCFYCAYGSSGPTLLLASHVPFSLSVSLKGVRLRTEVEDRLDLGAIH